MVALTQHSLVERPAQGAAKARSAQRWFVVLLCAICLEGLGRKFLPSLPSTAFYFAKDLILLAGLSMFGVAKDVRRLVLRLLGGWVAFFPIGFVWTLFECFNPDVPLFGLSILGMRSYWLWWVAPLVMASALRHGDTKSGALRALAWMALLVGGFAALQFARPSTDSLNTYALYDGQELNAVDVVSSTGRVRVSSTFSYLTGFTLFAQVAGTILVALGIGTPNKRVQRLSLLGALACLVTLPMGGSRAPVALMAVGLAVVAWSAGLIATRVGRRVITGLVVGSIGIFVLSPEALEGVVNRFNANQEESSSRVTETLAFMPPFVFEKYDFPLIGTGTGSEQNAAYALGVRGARRYGAESEAGKILVEQGPVGWMILWFMRVGMIVALVRLGRRFKRTELRALSGCCLAIAAYAFWGRLFFDHVSQSLLFVAVGLLLAYGLEVDSRQRQARPQARVTGIQPRS